MSEEAPAKSPQDAPAQYAKWLDPLREPMTLRRCASLDVVAQRLRQNNPRLREDRAAWLAPHWSRQDADGLYSILGDPAHKRINPVLYRVEEVLACWSAIQAPVLWVEGRETDTSVWWGQRYPRQEFEQRLRLVPQLARSVLGNCGHMLHHDQPEALAAALEEFLR